jgi:hypothetical protein
MSDYGKVPYSAATASGAGLFPARIRSSAMRSATWFVVVRFFGALQLAGRGGNCPRATRRTCSLSVGW